MGVTALSGIQDQEQAKGEDMSNTAAFDWAGVVNYAKRRVGEVPKTQYELPGVNVENHCEVPVACVPMWHSVVTARLTIQKGDKAALNRAQERLDKALAAVEAIYPLYPDGILIQVAYGLPYFREFIPKAVADKLMPRVIENGKPGDWAITDAIKYPKDPARLVLEQNDISFHFKSDYGDHISEVMRALFEPGPQTLNGIPTEDVYVGDLFTLTSIRRGFAGHGMPRVMAQRLGIPGADKIPPGAMLFMGFTSSHVHGLAQGTLPSFETIPGYTDQTPDSYFANGTMMHLSHIEIDLEGWYGLDHPGRLQRMFHARRTEGEDILSPSQAPDTTYAVFCLRTTRRRTSCLAITPRCSFSRAWTRTRPRSMGRRFPKARSFFCGRISIPSKIHSSSARMDLSVPHRSRESTSSALRRPRSCSTKSARKWTEWICRRSTTCPMKTPGSPSFW